MLIGSGVNLRSVLFTLVECYWSLEDIFVDVVVVLCNVLEDFFLIWRTVLLFGRQCCYLENTLCNLENSVIWRRMLF